MTWQTNALYVAAAGATVLVVRRVILYFTRCCTSKALMVGKTVLITGANTGIGKTAALELAKRQARVILACRDMEKAQQAADEIKRKSRNGQIVVKKLDLASFRSVREFCEDLKRSEQKIDVLINNAGVMNCPYALTEDGLETHWAVNHFGNFLLTNLLLEILYKADSPRVIFVSSSLLKYGKINFDDFNSHEQYKKSRPYSDSKLGNVLFARELHRREKEKGKLSVYTLHPGVVNTELNRYMIPGWIKFLLTPMWLMLRSPTEGCQTIVYCAVAPELEGKSGHCYFDCKQDEWKGPALDDTGAKRLWEVSEKVTNL